MAERLRWKIVDLVDRLLPGQCWTDLVLWVLARPEDRAENRLPWQPIGYTCRRDFAAVGSCYCGAMRERAPEEFARWLRSMCCYAPVAVAEDVERISPEDWAAFPLRCMGCGRDVGCLVEVERYEAWADLSREVDTATGAHNQGAPS